MYYDYLKNMAMDQASADNQLSRQYEKQRRHCEIMIEGLDRVEKVLFALNDRLREFSIDYFGVVGARDDRRAANEVAPELCTASRLNVLLISIEDGANAAAIGFRNLASRL